jgi:hypothetical protein
MARRSRSKGSKFMEEIDARMARSVGRDRKWAVVEGRKTSRMSAAKISEAGLRLSVGIRTRRSGGTVRIGMERGCGPVRRDREGVRLHGRSGRR